MTNAIKDAVGQKGDIKFEFTNGVSIFKGSYQGVGDQIFQIKNIYLVVLLYLDQMKGKTMRFGDLRMFLKTSSSSGKKRASTNELERTIIELLHSGIIRSPNKEIKEKEPDVAKVVESDEFTLNLKFNFEEEQKRQGRPAKMIKKMKIIPNQQLTVLPRWLEAAFKQELTDQKL